MDISRGIFPASDVYQDRGVFSAGRGVLAIRQRHSSRHKVQRILRNGPPEPISQKQCVKQVSHHLQRVRQISMHRRTETTVPSQ